MVSDQNICEASLQSSTNGGNICRTSSCDKNHLCAFFSDFLFQRRNSITCEVVWRRFHQFVNAAPFSIKNPVVDIHDWMERLHRIDLFPTEDSSHYYFIICMWGPESYHEHICFLTELDCLPCYREISIQFHDRL